jgi:hypothetical protein
MARPVSKWLLQLAHKQSALTYSAFRATPWAKMEIRAFRSS